MNSLPVIEDVRGVVVGGYTRKVALQSPNGNIQAETSIPIEEDPVAWGKDQLRKIRETKCGDGQTLGFHKHIAEMIYGKGEWFVRIYN